MTFERTITYMGETLSVTEWAKRTGLKAKTIYMRLNIGWTVERTLEAPLKNQNILKTETYQSEEEKRKERELVRFYLKTQSSDVEESRDEGEIL